MASKTSRLRVPGVIASLRALSAELDRLDAAAANFYGLNRTDMRALEIIGRAGPLAPTDLARQLNFTTAAVTTIIDRLERAGYAQRTAAATGRRRLLIVATDTTRQRDLAVFGKLMAATNRLVQTYTDDELAVIDNFLNRTREITAAYSQTLAHTTEAKPDTPTGRRARG